VVMRMRLVIAGTAEAYTRPSNLGARAGPPERADDVPPARDLPHVGREPCGHTRSGGLRNRSTRFSGSLRPLERLRPCRHARAKVVAFSPLRRPCLDDSPALVFTPVVRKLRKFAHPASFTCRPRATFRRASSFKRGWSNAHTPTLSSRP